MSSFERLINLSESQKNLSALIVQWQYAVDNNPSEFSDPITRLNYLQIALSDVLGDGTPQERDFLDRTFFELGDLKTPRHATLKSRDGFRLALGCLAI